jgi:pimeloyl-ACP methyl ester carboxylesterase
LKIGTPEQIEMKIKNFSVVKSIHKIANPVFKMMGYQLEEKTFDNYTIGFWRKTFSTKSSTKKVKPKRLVVIPGFADSSFTWVSYLSLLLPVIKANFDELIVVDLSWYNGFFTDKKPLKSMDQLISVLFKTLDSLEVDTLMGHSLGGWVSAWYSASRETNSPRKIILISPGGVLTGEEQELHEWKAKFDKAKEHGFSTFRPNLFAKEPFWFSLLAKEGAGFFNDVDIHNFIDSIGRKHFLSEELNSIKSEVCIIWGDNDNVCLSKWYKEWISGIQKSPKVSVFIVENAGHLVYVEKPFITAGLISKALTGKERNLSTYFFSGMGWKLIT